MGFNLMNKLTLLAWFKVKVRGYTCGMIQGSFGDSDFSEKSTLFQHYLHLRVGLRCSLFTVLIWLEIHSSCGCLKLDSAWGNRGFQGEFSLYFFGVLNFNILDYLVGITERTGSMLQASMGATVQRLQETGGVLGKTTYQTYWITVFLNSVSVNIFLLTDQSKLQKHS